MSVLRIPAVYMRGGTSKGVFFRVRVGDYGSRQAAVDAKSEFERKQRIIAYVAKL